jgi:hypothetical protein
VWSAQDGKCMRGTQFSTFHPLVLALIFIYIFIYFYCLCRKCSHTISSICTHVWSTQDGKWRGAQVTTFHPPRARVNFFYFCIFFLCILFLFIYLFLFIFFTVSAVTVLTLSIVSADRVTHARWKMEGDAIRHLPPPRAGVNFYYYCYFFYCLCRKCSHTINSICRRSHARVERARWKVHEGDAIHYLPPPRARMHPRRAQAGRSGGLSQRHRDHRHVYSQVFRHSTRPSGLGYLFGHCAVQRRARPD